MREVVSSTKRKITLLVLLAIFVICGVMYFGLQYASLTQINKPVSTIELHEHVKDDPSLHQYVESQKQYEAHFISLANKIRTEDSVRISEMVAVFALASIVCGSIICFLLVRTLMKPIIRAQASQERFLQDAAHELRNPLAVLTVALQQYDKNKNAKPLVSTINRQTKRLVGITEDLLFLEAHTKGRSEIYDLKDLLEDIVEELQPLASKSLIKLAVSSDAVRKTLVASHYIRIVKNIIDNAIKYSPQGGRVVISQKVVKSSVIITVTDSGIGIPKEELANIGSRFFRASNVGRVDGTGLGLAIVKKLLNLYSGTVSIESTKSGTTVIIRLPR
jgi:signal transduction histidine kinase